MSTARHPITPEDLWRIQRVGCPVASRAGDFVVVGVTSYDVEANEGTERLWLLRPGSEPRPLTAPDASSSGPAPSPDGTRLAFLRKPRRKDDDKAPGADAPQLHVMPIDGGEARLVARLPLGASDPRWFPDGKRVCVVSEVYREDMTLDGTRRIAEQLEKRKVKARVTEDRVFRFWDRWLTDGKVPHLFAIDVETGSIEDLLPESDRWFDLMGENGQYDISPDGNSIVFSANATSPPFDRLRWAIFLLDVGTKEVRCITPDHPADATSPRWTKDGRAVIYGAKRRPDLWCDRVRLCRWDRATGTHAVLTEGWDVSAGAWETTEDGLVAILGDVRARTALFRMRDDAPEGTTPELCTTGGTLTGIQPLRGGGVVLRCDSLSRPPEVARAKLEPGAELVRMTRFNDELVQSFALGAVREEELEGAAGERVHAWMVEPPGYDSSRPWPLVHLIHGGPYGTFADTWHFRWNAHLFAARGYLVAMVNFHGSSSFGERFALSILGDWGGKPAQDILRITDVLVERKLADPGRMAIAGGSYGGYMTAWLASQTNRFRCGVVHACVFDLAGMYSGDVTQDLPTELGGEPWGSEAERANIRRNDPASFAQGYATPLLVLHGEKDYRCPDHNGLYLYGVLKARGVPARLVHYPDENHWILKPQNSLHWFGEVLGWLDRHLA